MKLWVAAQRRVGALVAGPATASLKSFWTKLAKREFGEDRYPSLNVVDACLKEATADIDASVRNATARFGHARELQKAFQVFETFI